MKLQISIFAFLIIGFISCDAPGTDILYAESFLEVDAATNVTGEQTFTYQKNVDGQSIPSGFIVNLAAAQQTEAVAFNFEVDASSTATEGVHFEVNGNSAIILANTSTTELPIAILDDNIEEGETWSIVINISSSNIPVNPNYMSGKHLIQIIP